MEEKNSLRGFLVKKFLMVIFEIAICEFVINLLYSSIVFPGLRDKIGGPFFTNLGDGAYGSSALYTTFFWFFGEALLFLLPDIAAKSVRSFINTYFYRILPQEIGVLPKGNGQEVWNLYYIGCLILLLLLIFIALLPYAAGAVRFGRLIQKEMEQRWKEGRERQQEYERRRSLMLSDIAHDLKTPITTINGYAQALRDEVVTGDDKKKQYLNAICNKSQRMDDLISLLFEYVKIDSEGFSLHMEQADIVEVLRENVALFYADFERKGIEVELDIPEQCIWWEIDKIQFSRAVANLLNNELRHVEKGEMVVIRLRWDEDRERISILFGDTGEQIPDEIAKHIFEPFVMGDASRSTKGGSGLGLSISSKIVKMHGGRLYLDRNSTEEYKKAFVIVLWN
ncbi:sensor histidine kinase [bacterium D16-51]|nr:sensor histidine kinase [bacterium D16-59]RKI59378.1 sensor histidine kinase [bacterium D16-51]